MKARIILLSAGLIGFTGLQARHLDPDAAWQRAGSQPGMNKVRGLNSTAKPTLIRTVSSADGQGSVYMFKTGDAAAPGFVLMPSDDCAMPVLAYGDGEIDETTEMPPALREWLNMYAAEIAYAAEHGASAYKAPEENSLEEIAPLLTCKWDQMYPYNMFTPKFNETENCATGCVATAMAQVMHYHKYPAKGVGSHSYTSTILGEDVTLSANFGETEYKWDDMLDSYAEDAGTAVQKEAVARLMADVGVAIDMGYALYNTNTSGVVTAKMHKRLTDYFGYSPTAVGRYKLQHTEQAWKEMLHKNLQESGPLVYSGNDGQSGHCFVCDGYKDDKFHFNWGWSGNMNGYFSLSALNPGAGGTGAGSGGYSLDQYALFNLRPAKEEDKTTIYLEGKGSLKFAQPTYNIPSTITVDMNRSTHPGFFALMPDRETPVRFGLMFTNAESGESYVVEGPRATLSYTAGVRNFDINIERDMVPPGEYVVRAAAKALGCEPEGEWCFFDQSISTIRAYNATVANNFVQIHNPAAVEAGDKLSSSVPGIHQLKVESITCNGEEKSGADGSLTATISNNKVKYEGTISVNLIDSEGVIHPAGKSETVTVEGNGTADINITYTMAAPEGKYHMVLTDKDGTHFYEREVTLAKGELSVDEVTDNNEKLTIYPNPADKYVKLNGVADGESVELYDISGRRAKSVKLNGGEISLEGLTPGMYLIRACGQTARLIIK